MEFLDLLIKKRDGEKLIPDEINFIVERYVSGNIPDYQMAAFLMAVYFNSLDREETTQLTRSMANSGDRLDLSSLEGVKVDKHSSGGVGDSVSLVLVPLIGALGLKIGKLSGRGLGHTGGTIDKLESIPGFRVSLTTEELLNGVRQDGIAIMEHTSELVPADQKLYELRDVTGTVKSLPLIISSIMSKKIACGPDGIVLDIKTGSGAIMREYERARELAQGCVDIGKEVGLTVSSLITDMNQPLGKTVGNALEVREAIEVLKNETSGDLREVTVSLAAELLLQADKVESVEEGVKLAEDRLASGLALEKFEKLIENQGGNPEVVGDPSLLPISANRLKIQLKEEGYVSNLDALKIGRAANILGAGREEKDEEIDYAVGIQIERKVGDELTGSDPVAWIHYNKEENLEKAERMVRNAYSVSSSPPSKPELIKERIR